MKEIMHEYGRTLITIIVALLLFLIVFGKVTVEGNVGAVDILTSQTTLTQKDYQQYADAKEVAHVIEREQPVLTCQYVTILAGSSRKAEDIFLGMDADGNKAELTILKAESPDKSEAEFTDNQIKFQQQGIYRIWVKATDTSCKVTQKVFEIPVVCR